MSSRRDEKEVFLQALQLAGEEREAFLREACPDPALRERIHELLRHHAEATGSTLDQEPASRAAPERVDEFRILRQLGAGGMGVVYLAEDTILDRQVAIKLVAGHLETSDDALQRFKREARTAAKLQHPAIVPVFKFGFDGKYHYIVSEYVDGPTLGSLIAQEHATRRDKASTQSTKTWIRRSAEIASAIADALDSAHRAGVVHCDV